jgi:hypothetical protein
MASSKYSNRGSLPAVRRAAVAGVILTAVLSVAVVAHSLGVLKGTAVLLLGVGVAVLLTLTSIITVRMRLRPPTSSTFRRLTYSRPVEVLAGTSVLAVVSMASITVASGVAVHFTLVSAQTPPSPSTGSLSPTPSTGYRPYGPLSQPNLQVDANGPRTSFSVTANANGKSGRLAVTSSHGGRWSDSGSGSIRLEGSEEVGYSTTVTYQVTFTDPGRDSRSVSKQVRTHDPNV